YKANLQGAYLFRANLQGAKLLNANLQGANLEYANLQGANLYDANLQEAKLEEANLQGASLYKANLQGADLSGANLQGAKLEEANLRGVQCNWEYRKTIQNAIKNNTPLETDLTCITLYDNKGNELELNEEEKKAWFRNKGANVDDLTAEEVQKIFKDLVQEWFKKSIFDW
ncbi:MAG: pentapeptide repeat-containing protein, partial [Planctomycetaceae bacterium]|nr:pentapeptide repeat-containing protein [Planctomycetaceae bacterium]